MLGKRGDGTWVRVALCDFRGYAINALCRAAARIANFASRDTGGPFRETGIAQVGQSCEFVVRIATIRVVLATVITIGKALASLKGTGLCPKRYGLTLWILNTCILALLQPVPATKPRI